MSGKRRRNLVNGQNRIKPIGFTICIICSIMTTGYEPHKAASDRMRVVVPQDATA